MKSPIRVIILISTALLAISALVVALVVYCRPHPKGDFFQIVREDKKYSVSLDLSDPKNYSGIPAVTWFPMRDREFCAIQGLVATDIKLPDGKRITEEFAILYIDRDADGILGIRSDSLGWLRTDKALLRLKREIHERASDLDSFERYTERAREISTWMTSYAENKAWNKEWRKGFRVQRVGYELNFIFFIFGRLSDGIRFTYDIRLRKPGREPTPEPPKRSFSQNGVSYQVPLRHPAIESEYGAGFADNDEPLYISEYQYHDQLTVNNIDAGKVKRGDNVIIDISGQVLVNGIQRIKGLPIRAFFKIRKDPALAWFLHAYKGKISPQEAISALESTDKVTVDLVTVSYADAIATIITDADESLLDRTRCKLSCICPFRDANGDLHQFRVLKLSPEEKAALIRKLQAAATTKAP